MQFEEEEKVAIAVCLQKMIQADGKINGKESLFLHQIIEPLRIQAYHLVEAGILSVKDVEKALAGMDKEKKRFVVALIKKMSSVDGEVSRSEEDLIAEVKQVQGFDFE